MKRLLFSLVIAGPGVLAWLVGLGVFVQRVRLLRSGLRGTGTIVDEFVGSSTPSVSGGIRTGTTPAHFSVVEVQDATTGTPIRFRTTIGTSRTVVVVGNRVPVLYLPGLPDQAEIDRPMSLWGLPVLACLVGTVLLAAWWYLPPG